MTKNRKSTIHPSIETAYRDVPEIGATWKRWYDIPYRVLWWFIKGKLKKLTPRSFRALALQGVNNLLQFNEFERLKRWDRNDRMHNLNVPGDEHVTIPAVMTVEFFTPNEVPKLEKFIRKNGWDKQTRTYSESNSKRLAQARSRDGSSWWKLADIIDKNGEAFLPDAKRERLPEGISVIRLKAVQIGSGLTALVACFSLNEASTRQLDNMWHSSHEPFMQYAAGRFRPYDRKFAAYKAAQTTRRKRNDVIRKWMTERCPGYFASHNEAHLTLDVMLTEKYDPTSASKKVPDIDLQDALDALGINSVDFHRIIAPELPGMALLQADRLSSRPYLDSSRTWSLVSKRSKLQKATDNYKYSGGNANWAATHIAYERLGDTLILLAISELLVILEKQYSVLRDTAQLHHKNFKVRNLDKLNGILLDSSLTLASIRRDVKKLQENRWWFEGASFTTTVSPYFKDKIGKKEAEPLDMHKDILLQQGRTFTRLGEIDKDYRDILATISSLGAAASTIRLGRWALFVAAASLLVSAAAIAVSIMVASK